MLHTSMCREVLAGGGRFFVGTCCVPIETTLSPGAGSRGVKLAEDGPHPRWKRPGAGGGGADAAPSLLVAVHCWFRPAIRCLRNELAHLRSALLLIWPCFPRVKIGSTMKIWRGRAQSILADL